MERRLCKSNRDRFFAGVYGGIAEYFSINSWIVRLIFVCTSGGSVVSYIILALFLSNGNDI
jgi:phage shock protein PspC (stress-responsive transcriptional regulator)